MALEVVRAGSVRDAAALLADAGTRFVAGGTLAVRDVNAGDVSIQRLVLSDGLGLEGIVVGQGLAEVGAAASIAHVLAHPDLQFLRSVASSIGGPAVRAMATVGGNLFAPSPYGDFTVALLALDAEVSVEDAEKVRSLALEAFIAERGEVPAAIIRRVSFRLPPEGSFRFAKVVRKHPHGASVFSIAAILPVIDGRIAEARIAYGAMAPRPMRARAAERALEGKPLDDHSIAAAGAVAGEGCAPVSDAQASGWYRRQVLPVHLERLLRG